MYLYFRQRFRPAFIPSLAELNSSGKPFCDAFFSNDRRKNAPRRYQSLERCWRNPQRKLQLALLMESWWANQANPLHRYPFFSIMTHIVVKRVKLLHKLFHVLFVCFLEYFFSNMPGTWFYFKDNLKHLKLSYWSGNNMVLGFRLKCFSKPFNQKNCNLILNF